MKHLKRFNESQNISSKLKFEDESGDLKKKVIGVYLGKSDNFNGKNDPNLIKLAKEKIKEKILKLI